MTETQFIEQNKQKWKELESLLDRKSRNPDKLHELFVKVSSDLSYARTFYPNRSVRLYLNNLTQRVFDLIRAKEKNFQFKDVVVFFSSTLPLEIYRSRIAFYVSIGIFFTSFAIGVVSSANDPDFPRLMLGDAYISMTDANIEAGDPMAVYKDQSMVDMFLGITINNIRVAFLVFVLGLLGSIGTMFLLTYNGIMIGAFQYYFYAKGLFVTSFTTIWIHGTIEISAIIIAGAAGLILGNGLLFPRTYDRLISLQMAAKRSLTILVGTVPLFVIAGLLESFVTRQTDWPIAIRTLIIVLSLAFIFAIWVVLPIYLMRARKRQQSLVDLPPQHYPPFSYIRYQSRSYEQNMIQAFAQLRVYFQHHVKYIVMPTLIIGAIVFWYRLSVSNYTLYELGVNRISLFKYQDGGLVLFIFFWLTLACSLLLLGLFNRKGQFSPDQMLPFIKQHYLHTFLISLICVVPVYFFGGWLAILMLILLTPQFLVAYNELHSDNEDQSLTSIQDAFAFSWRTYPNYLPSLILLICILSISMLLINSGFSDLIVAYFSWHEVFEHGPLDLIFIKGLMQLGVYVAVLPFAYFLLSNQYYSDVCRYRAIDLKKQFESFGQNTSLMEER